MPRPTTHNVVGSKWVFRTKFHADGTIERLKARLVAQGFTQIPRIDYSHTFSPVVKASTVRTILALAVLRNWPLHQLVVNNAFLNGSLTETVFMEQPPGYSNPRFPITFFDLRRPFMVSSKLHVLGSNGSVHFLPNLGFAVVKLTHLSSFSLEVKIPFIFSFMSTTLFSPEITLSSSTTLSLVSIKNFPSKTLANSIIFWVWKSCTLLMD